MPTTNCHTRVSLRVDMGVTNSAVTGDRHCRESCECEDNDEEHQRSSCLQVPSLSLLERRSGSGLSRAKPTIRKGSICVLSQLERLHVDVVRTLVVQYVSSFFIIVSVVTVDDLERDGHDTLLGL